MMTRMADDGFSSPIAATCHSHRQHTVCIHYKQQASVSACIDWISGCSAHAMLPHTFPFPPNAHERPPPVPSQPLLASPRHHASRQAQSLPHDVQNNGLVETRKTDQERTSSRK